MRLARWVRYITLFITIYPVSCIIVYLNQRQSLGFKSQNVQNARWLEYTDKHIKFKAIKADMRQGHAD